MLPQKRNKKSHICHVTPHWFSCHYVYLQLEHLTSSKPVSPCLSISSPQLVSTLPPVTWSTYQHTWPLIRISVCMYLPTNPILLSQIIDCVQTAEVFQALFLFACLLLVLDSFSYCQFHWTSPALSCSAFELKHLLPETLQSFCKQYCCVLEFGHAFSTLGGICFPFISIWYKN